MTEGYQTCAPLFAALKEIPYAVIKGAVLLKDAYGSPFQTAMSHQTAPFVEQTANPRCPYVNADMGVPIRNLYPEMVFLSLPAPLQGHEFHLSPI